MPIYEYHCESCNYDFELLQGINESHSATCPLCKKKAMKKISLPGGLVFKGSGFYITDYNKSNGNGGSHSSITSSEKKVNGNGNGSEKKSQVESTKIDTNNK